MSTKLLTSIFTDASFDKESGCGVAGMLLVEGAIEAALDPWPKVATREFQNTNCTRLEIEAVIWALEAIPSKRGQEVCIYTDCRNVVDLSNRRSRLEGNGFTSTSTGRPLNNGHLYRIFFKLVDDFNPRFVWVKGHKPKKDKGSLIDLLFSTVDKETRKALRRNRVCRGIER